MRVAVVGSKEPVKDLRIEEILPEETHMIISGGDKGMEQQAAKFALEHEISLVEVMSDERKFGDHARLVRNSKIVELADYVVAIWDEESKDVQLTIELANEMYKPVDIYQIG